MPDPAKQLQMLYSQGFTFEIFERYPKCVGVLRDGIIAVMTATPDGLQMVGDPGWRMGEVLGVLTQKNGRQIFQFKDEIVEATPERLEALRRFREDLEQALVPRA